MKRIRIKHTTEYTFPSTVTLQQHYLLIRPREGHDVRIESSLLDITPAYQIKWFRDVFDNSLAEVTFLAPTEKLSITSEVVIQHYEESPLDFWIEDYAVDYPFKYAETDWADLAAFQRPIFINDQGLIQQWLNQLGVLNGSIATFELLNRMNQAIHSQFNYQIREEPGVQTPSTTLNNNSGSCRDYATLFIEACRYLGLASRFVSGYLHAPATEAGNASTHAWAEVYLPGTGWKGFDPTAGEVTGTQHIAVAVSRDPEAVPPIAGTFTGPSILPALMVDVQVNLLTE